MDFYTKLQAQLKSAADEKILFVILLLLCFVRCFKIHCHILPPPIIGLAALFAVSAFTTAHIQKRWQTEFEGDMKISKGDNAVEYGWRRGLGLIIVQVTQTSSQCILNLRKHFITKID